MRVRVSGRQHGLLKYGEKKTPFLQVRTPKLPLTEGQQRDHARVGVDKDFAKKILEINRQLFSRTQLNEGEGA